MDETKYHPLPQPGEIGVREREDAMGAYLMMFAAIGAGLPLPVINLIAAFVYYYLNRSKSRFVRFHAAQSLYSQLPTSLMNAGAVGWAVRNWYYHNPFTDNFWGYLIMVVVVNIFYFVFSIIGAIRARKGRFYYFIFFGRLAYHEAYLIRNESKAAAVNKPPV